MAIDIQWEDQQQHILHYRFVDLWNWSELLTSNRQAQQMLKGINHNVTVILDFTRDDILRYRNQLPLLGALMQFPSNQGTIILVGAMPYIGFVEQIMKRFHTDRGHNYRSAADLVTAHKMIEAATS